LLGDIDTRMSIDNSASFREGNIKSEVSSIVMDEDEIMR
jgi:hypothetical protein